MAARRAVAVRLAALLAAAPQAMALAAALVRVAQGPMAERGFRVLAAQASTRQSLAP
jgi:hypothetical protein